MKKVSVVFMALVIMALCSFSAFAAPNNFISSPSENQAPVIVEAENEDGECTAVVTITPYSKRQNLSSNSKSNMEKAYKNIVETPDLSKLNSDLEKAAKDKGVDPEKLAVSDLFNLEYTDCEVHDDHGKFRIKLSADTLKNFVGLMMFDGENWKLISDASVSDSIYLTFTADELANFAIVVARDSISPATGDSFPIEMIVVVMLGSLCAFAVVSRKFASNKA